MPVHRTKFEKDELNFVRKRFNSPCVFIGYSLSHKGYKVLDSHSNRIFISMDVKFHEMHFPIHMDKKDDSFPSIFPTYVYLLSVTTILADDYSSVNHI